MTPSHLRLSENGYYPCSLGLSYITEPITPLFLFNAPTPPMPSPVAQLGLSYIWGTTI